MIETEVFIHSRPEKWLAWSISLRKALDLSLRSFILAVMLWGIFNTAVYSADETAPHDLRVVKGKVAAVDWVASVLIVRTVDARGTPDEIRFVVSDKAKITKGTDIITLGNLNKEDRVIVEYYADSFMGLVVMRITVQI